MGDHAIHPTFSMCRYWVEQSTSGTTIEVQLQLQALGWYCAAYITGDLTLRAG